MVKEGIALEDDDLISTLSGMSKEFKKDVLDMKASDILDAGNDLLPSQIVERLLTYVKEWILKVIIILLFTKWYQNVKFFPF